MNPALISAWFCRGCDLLLNMTTTGTRQIAEHAKTCSPDGSYGCAQVWQCSCGALYNGEPECAACCTCPECRAMMPKRAKDAGAVRCGRCEFEKRVIEAATAILAKQQKKDQE